MCIGRQPVGRKERISSTLGRRSSCHFRICRGISLFLPLSSQRPVRRKAPGYLPVGDRVLVAEQSAVPLPKNNGQGQTSHPARCSVQGQPRRSTRSSSSPIDPRMDPRRLIDSLDSLSARAPLPLLLWTRGGKNNTFKCNEAPFTALRLCRGGCKAPRSKLKCGK